MREKKVRKTNWNCSPRSPHPLALARAPCRQQSSVKETRPPWCGRLAGSLASYYLRTETKRLSTLTARLMSPALVSGGRPPRPWEALVSSLPHLQAMISGYTASSLAQRNSILITCYSLPLQAQGPRGAEGTSRTATDGVRGQAAATRSSPAPSPPSGPSRPPRGRRLLLLLSGAG